MPVLEKIIIGVTNSSLSEVEIQTDSRPYRRDNSIPRKLIGMKIQPRDKDHENYVVSKMNLLMGIYSDQICYISLPHFWTIPPILAFFAQF